ncbi:hypothetical protein MKX83_24170 [Cytobacillus sp. FSL M8-0252]|uniref:AbiTii domain-containing protein n=1 Tax=Cytobacillus sp. FSL M8-0252 TaxID=2921621 RepID=UPI0030FAAEC3
MAYIYDKIREKFHRKGMSVMARSQLLKDAVEGKVSIQNILMRLKVILSDLKNENIMNWVNGELQGYNDDDLLPTYRVFKGNVIGNYLINYTVQYNLQPVPLQHLISKEQIDEISTLRITDGISTVQNILQGERRENYARVIPTEYSHAISTEAIQIAGMRVLVPSNRLDGIVSQVKSKLIDVIMELEKEFNNLDELDIRSQVEESTTITNFNNIIENIIYDESIKIGDKNKIEKTSLGHLFGNNK